MPIAENKLSLSRSIAKDELQKTLDIWCKFRIGFIVVLAYFMAVAQNAGEGFSGHIVGYWLGSLFWPFLLAYLIAGRKSVRNWNRFSLWFFWVGLLIPAFIYNLRHHDSPKNTNERIASVIQQATGKQPVSSSGSPIEQDEDAILRGMVAELTEVNKKYQKLGVELDLSKLYTAESFSSHAAIRGIIKETDTAVKLDNEISAKMSAIIAHTRDQIFATNWRESRKKRFWTDFQEGYNQTADIRNRAVSIENQWGEATKDLYAFASKNLNNIVVRKGEVLIANDDIRSAFNEKLHRAQRLSEALDRINVQVEQQRADFLKKLNLSAADVGIKP